MKDKKTEMKKSDAYTYRFYIDFILMAVCAFILIDFSSTVNGSLIVLLHFPESVEGWFIAACIVGGLAVAYKVLSVIFKGFKNSILTPNFVLGWGIAFFVTMGVLFFETKNSPYAFYSETLTVYGILLGIYALCSITNFFLGGDFFEKQFKKLLKK